MYTRRDILYRNVSGNHADPQIFTDHKHQHVLTVCTGLQVFGMTRKLEFTPLDVVLVDRSGNERIDLASYQIIYGVLQREECILSANLIFFAQTDFHFLLPTIDDIRAFMMGLLGRIDHMKTKIINSQCFAMKRSDLGMSIHNGGKIFQYPIIHQSLDNNLQSDPVYIAYGNSYLQFIAHLRSVVWLPKV